MQWSVSGTVYPNWIRSLFTILLYYLTSISAPLHGTFVIKHVLGSWKKIQERALRFIYEDYHSSYETLLQRINLPSLHVRRMRTLAIESYKILHDLSPDCLTDLVKFKSQTYNFRYTNVLEIPKVRTVSYGTNSFRYTAAVLWNSLSAETREQSNFNQFKYLINAWNGSECPCNICK